MTRCAAAVVMAVLLAATAATATAAELSSPYVGLEGRSVKALSVEETRGLLAGEGLSLSLAAELNGYPGPRHVIQLGRELRLDEQQVARAVALEADMKRDAMALGTKIVALEEELEHMFRTGHAHAAAVERIAGEIAAKRGALRAVHLRAHLGMAEALSSEQRSRYMALRGYAETSASPAHDPAQQRHRH